VLQAQDIKFSRGSGCASSQTSGAVVSLTLALIPDLPGHTLVAVHYTSIEEAALDMLLLSAQSRCAEYSQEVQQFEAKYHMDFTTFQRLVETRVHEEDFAQEEDLMAWKFAQDAADYWRQKTEELKRAAGAGEAIC
jgi:hypothetical protein